MNAPPLDTEHHANAARAAAPTGSTGVIYTTEDRVEALAWLHHVDIEIADDYAEVRVGRVVYRAPFGETRAELLAGRVAS